MASGTGKRVEAASASRSASPSCGRLHSSAVHEHRKEAPPPPRRAQSFGRLECRGLGFGGVEGLGVLED
jgi:hypothetical protein